MYPHGFSLATRNERAHSLSLSLVHNQPDVSLGWPGIFLLPMMLFPLTTIPKAVKTETE